MSTLKQLQDLVQEKFGIDAATLDPNTSMTDKGFDSLAKVEFAFAVEDLFGISIPDEDTHIDTLAQAAEMVDRLLADKAAKAA